MAIVEGGAIGLDEGAIFEALSKPLYTKTVVKYRHNKQGLVTSETTKTWSVSSADILAAAGGGALLTILYGLAKIDVPEEVKTGWANWFGLMDIVRGAGWIIP